MTGELNQILSRVTMRTRERHIDAAIDELAIRRGECRQVGPAGWVGSETPDYSMGQRERSGPAQANDSQRGAARWSGECGNGVREHGSSPRSGLAFGSLGTGLGGSGLHLDDAPRRALLPFACEHP